jgi:hypothetical protein
LDLLCDAPRLKQAVQDLGTASKAYEVNKAAAADLEKRESDVSAREGAVQKCEDAVAQREDKIRAVFA